MAEVAVAIPVTLGTIMLMNVTFPYPDPETIALAGDWHGNTACALTAVRTAAAAGAKVLIQLGDFGIWSGHRGSSYLHSVSELAKELDIEVLFIDGNHENFDLLAQYPIDPVTGMRPIAANLNHLPRGSRWEWAGVRFCGLGGATSLDRLSRIVGHSWWMQESLNDVDVNEVIDGGETDVLLTHDCPDGVAIPGIDKHKSLLQWPETELRSAWNHRETLAVVTGAVRPTHMFHGHFHIAYQQEVELSTGLCTLVHGLGDDNGDPGDNLMLLDLQGLAREVLERRRSHGAAGSER